MMPKQRYPVRNYVVGELLFTLRNRTKLTQAQIAKAIGISRRSVQKWESGETSPTAENLRALIALLTSLGALTPGEEHNEVLTLWQSVSEHAPHHFPLFNETWFDQLLAAHVTHEMGNSRPEHEAARLKTSTIPSAPFALAANYFAAVASPASRVDWGLAFDVPVLYGRLEELATLTQWVMVEQCRLVTLMGIGGIGKTSLALAFAQQIVPHFAAVVFRSLGEAPPLGELLDYLLHRLAAQPIITPSQLSDKLTLLIDLLRKERCLLILDNLETLQQSSTVDAHYLPGYEGYATLFRTLGETAHQSCLLLTTRERPMELTVLDGPRAPVRSLRLQGLPEVDCRILLAEQGLVGTTGDAAALARRFDGNPLALKLVTEPIRTLFGGDIAAFLTEGALFFAGVGQLLEQQISRTSPLEMALLIWLVIAREPVTPEQLLHNLIGGASRGMVLAALQALWRRNLIERGQLNLTFTLQRVVLDYLTERLVERAAEEITQRNFDLLLRYALIQATAKDYVRHMQERLIAAPLLAQLVATLSGADKVEQHLVKSLQRWQGQPMTEQGYGPGNVVNLLRVLRGHLRALDLARLTLRQAYFQGVEMQDTTLAGATSQDSAFTEMFRSPTAVAISSTGEYWAAASRHGEVLVWTAGGQVLHRAWRAHTDMIPTLTFSPDGHTLATAGGWKDNVKLWDVATGALIWAGSHSNHVNTVQFSPDGRLLASSGDDATARLWDVHRGTQQQILPHPAPVAGVTWSPDGSLLATGDAQGTLRLWEIQDNAPPLCQQSFSEHAERVDALAFAPDGNTLASASWDGTVKLWNTSKVLVSGQVGRRVRQALVGHISRVTRLAWSPDGQILAGCSRDRTLRLWDVKQDVYRLTLHGHSDGFNGLAFTPDGNRLLSSSESGALYVWDITTGECLHVIQGHSNSLFSVDWSPDGTHLVSGGTDRVVTIYALDLAQPTRTLQGHSDIVLGVGWSPNGHWLASSEWDNIVRLWDATAGTLVQQLQHLGDTHNYFSALAWSLDGRLACGSYRHGVLVWDKRAQSCHWLAHQRPTWIRTLAWRADGGRLAGGDEYGAIYVWNADDYTCLRAMADAHSTVMCLTWEPTDVADGARLASGGLDKGGGALYVWNTASGERLYALAGHPAMVCAVAWGAQAEIVISGDSEGTLRWWNLHRGDCLRVQQAHEGSVQSLRRSPDGTRLASCGDDGAIRLWDLHSGDYLQTLRRDRPYERMDITGLLGLIPAQMATLKALGALEISNKFG